jgi:phospholipase C
MKHMIIKHYPRRLPASAVFALAATGLFPVMAIAASGAPQSRNATPIQHVIIIMQENRSFDSYFGTFPGAQGAPKNTCVPLDPSNPNTGCVAPFHDQHDVNAGGPHSASSAQQDADNGIATQKMDGFILTQTNALSQQCKAKAKDCPLYVPGTDRHDVMGYHTAAELPNYWAYATNFVLQDELFEGVRGWSFASHLDLTSEWSAECTNPLDVATCATNPIGSPPNGNKVLYPWVNLFQLLDLNGVSWKYYLATGTEPDCDDDAMTCDPQVQNNGILSLWNPAPGFASVQAQGPAYLASHNPPLDQFLVDIKAGTLPQVSWIVPSNEFSEHPVAGITAGQEYVTSLINAVMQSPYWSNTAIFLAWDDWGGFYDHFIPPIVDMNGTSTPVQGFGFLRDVVRGSVHEQRAARSQSTGRA